MITRNDYNLKLFNGDIGIILPEKDSGEPRAFFPGPDNALRQFLPLRLPEHETAYALTVHKSQGSEFDRVLLVLPDRESPVLSRELLYTGLTRARKSVELWFEEAVFSAALARRVSRTSGLRDAFGQA
jgi:exodeoxyribonuclease V alpha subunit